MDFCFLGFLLTAIAPAIVNVNTTNCKCYIFWQKNRHRVIEPPTIGAYVDMYETSTDFSRLGAISRKHKHTSTHSSTTKRAAVAQNTRLSVFAVVALHRKAHRSQPRRSHKHKPSGVKSNARLIRRRDNACCVPGRACLCHSSRYILCMCFSTSYASEENMFGEHTDSYAPYMAALWHLMRSASEGASRRRCCAATGNCKSLAGNLNT